MNEERSEERCKKKKRNLKLEVRFKKMLRIKVYEKFQNLSYLAQWGT